MHGIQALTTIPDPRRRRGRHSPRFSLRAIVLRAAMHPTIPHMRRGWGVRDVTDDLDVLIHAVLV